MILRCFALSSYLYCLRLRCLVSFSFYSTIFDFVGKIIPLSIKKPSANRLKVFSHQFAFNLDFLIERQHGIT
ncbi:Uncharacterised protein [Neisseria animalis]|nr:Uncharacterised protein [Neisseria animalis]